MACGFTLEHYREILRAAREGGYRFAAFADSPVDGDLLLRHDIDLSLEAAIEMAELEAEEGATATYLLMNRSVSNNRWRSGCTHEELRAGAFPCLHLLVRPEIWVYPGATMSATMQAMLE